MSPEGHTKPAIILALAALCAFSQSLLDNVTDVPQSPEPVRINTKHTVSPSPDTLTVELTFSMIPGVHIYSAESLFFKIEQISAAGLGPSSVHLPAPKKLVNFDGTVADVFEDGQTIIIRRPIAAKQWVLAGKVHFQACDNKMCFMPTSKGFAVSSDGSVVDAVVEEMEADAAAQGDWKTLASEFNIAGSRGGYSDAATFLAFLENPGQDRDGGLAGKSMWAVVLLVILGGLALNFTPCVLPIIPITLAVIGAGTKARSRARGFVVGGVYGLGMTLAYGVAGSLVVATGARFGVINSSAAFNILIAVLFVLLALGMFDVFHIDFSRYRSGVPKPGSGGTLAAAFVMGALAALLAGACVAPVIISVVLYSADLYADGNRAGLLLPFLLGAGMALPWPFAGAGLSFLPKPGGWMIWVRNFFGLVILVIALFYGYTGVRIVLESRVPAVNKTMLEQPAQLPWIHSLAEGLQTAQNDNLPVFLDFWATWCKNCKAMDATTFRNSAVENKLRDYVLVKVQAEKPNDPDTKEILDHFKVVGLPTYVILEPR